MKGKTGLRPRVLRELADSIDIMNPADFSSQDDTTSNIKIKKANRELYWRNQSPAKPMSTGNESFEIAIISCGATFPMLRFMGQLDGMLNDTDSYGDILRTAYTSNRGTVITIQIQPSKLGNLMNKIAAMPEVAKVEKEPVATSAKICISLREPNFAIQEPELTPVLA